MGERAGGGLEGDLGAVRMVGRADQRQRRLRLAMLEADEIFRAVAPDAHFHPFGERIDHGGADAMQAAGDLVGILVELAAGMQLGQHHLGGGDAFLGMDIGRDAAPVIAHRHAAIAVQDGDDMAGIAGLRLVHRVVDDLEAHMVQAGAVIGVADIHARALADGIQPFQDADRGGVIGIVFQKLGLGLRHRLGHKNGCSRNVGTNAFYS